jgi:hypothetical protein
VAAEASTLKQATDVFWALDRLGYIASKEKPNPSSRGCTPYEYLAKRGEALFKISVFECGDAAQAKALVEHPDNQKVDSLLRNHHEGGMLQRGPLHIIIRKSSGDAKAADTLLEELGGL